MPIWTDDAVVLRTYPLGEADRVVVLLSKTQGKVRAVAKGVRRTSSKIGARLEPGNHVTAQLATGRSSLDVVTQTEGRHVFDFATDYPRFTSAQVMLEVADRLVAEDRAPAPRQYRLLLGALLALDRADIDTGLVVDSYVLRALATSGYGMAIDSCAGCGTLQAEGWFAAGLGGVLCTACKPAASSRVDTEVLSHLGALLAGEWSSISDVRRVRQRASGFIATFSQWQLDHALRSLPFLVRE